MDDNQTPAPEAGAEVVQTEVNEQTEAPEAAESTEGQEKNQPAEAKDESEKAEEITASKARRERRKAAKEAERQKFEAQNSELERVRRERDDLKSVLDQPPPKAEDFQDHDEYLSAMTAYRSVRTLDERQVKKLDGAEAEAQQRLQAMQQQREAEARENWATQSSEARARYADFDKVTSAQDLPITQEMAGQMALMENGADVAYHLGMNKGLAAELAGMHPQEMAGAMRMLGHTVSNATPKPKTQSTAPDPISTVRPNGTAKSDPDKMSPDEYRAWRQAGGKV